MIIPHHRQSASWIFAGAIAIVVLCLGVMVDREAYFASWLAAWWTCAGAVLGSQANLCLHDLTGGTWGSPLRPMWQRAIAATPMLLALMLPLIAAVWLFYPWSQAGWEPQSQQPGFKAAWLSPAFVTVRLIVYAVLWQCMALIYQRRDPDKSHKGASAMSLIVYGLTVSLASVDLIQALMPQWYSSGFGLIIVTMQMKLSFAIGVVGACRLQVWAGQAFPGGLGRDWGNLLLMYVLMWAYVAFVQFLIIWAENLPNEIAWYVPRLQTDWIWLGALLVLGGFFAPLLLLLFRAIKEDGWRLGTLAMALCVFGWLECIWITLPSAPGMTWHALWMAPLALAGMAALLWGAITPSRREETSGHLIHAMHRQESES